MLRRMATTSSVDAQARLEALRRQLRESGAVRISEAAGEFSVSQMTIRRDLAELEAMGFARRVRGGAVAMGPIGFDERKLLNAQAKATIAAKLMRLIPDTGAIGLDASTTVLRLATLLGGSRDLTVLTNSVETYEALHGRAGVAPLITGGSTDPRTGSLVGPLAVRAAQGLLLGRYFLSAAAIDATLGTSEACLEDAEVKQAFAASASEVVVAVDSSKLGRRAVAPGLGLSRIDVLATELDPSHVRLDPYRETTEVI